MHLALYCDKFVAYTYRVKISGAKIIVKKSPGKGRGVFATANIKANELIEAAPVIVLPDIVAKKKSPYNKAFEVINRYHFVWSKTSTALAMGKGSFINHSYEPNARYESDGRVKEMKFIALRPIKKGEEITVNYNGDHKCKDPIWFKVK